jgi:hypothetical protein
MASETTSNEISGGHTDGNTVQVGGISISGQSGGIGIVMGPVGQVVNGQDDTTDTDA